MANRTSKGRAYLTAWRIAPKIPEPILRAIANIAADVIWLKHGKGVKRLEANYARIRPELTANQIRALSRKGMRSYFRYFREAFTLSAVTADQLAARTRVIGLEHVHDSLQNFGSPIVALGHAGNWDLAGAWAATHVVPVLTVAEKLKPEEVYQAFVSFRESLGIEVFGLGDHGVFERLVAGGKAGGKIIPLLADRDLTHRGVEVNLCGHKARVAAGPAATSLAAGVPLLLATIHYERLHGTRRKAAGTPWGIVIEFSPVNLQQCAELTSNYSTTEHMHAQADGITREAPVILRAVAESRENDVQFLTQAWVTQFGEFLKAHTEDWHMLQKVFIADLLQNSLPSLLGGSP